MLLCSLITVCAVGAVRLSGWLKKSQGLDYQKKQKK